MRNKVKKICIKILFSINLFILGCGTNQDELLKDELAPESSYQEDLVSKGWRLIWRWDFYNQLEGWNHDTITKKDSGGYIQIEDGVLEFGYSKDGGKLYYQNKMVPVPNYSYMLISRVKTENPYRALVGFYNPEKKRLMANVKIRNDSWGIVKSILSIDPTIGQDIPKQLYPMVENLTRQDYTYIDWIEMWIYPRQKR